VLKLKVNLDDDDFVVDVECVRAPDLPLGAGLLLSAAAADGMAQTDACTAVSVVAVPAPSVVPAGAAGCPAWAVVSLRLAITAGMRGREIMIRGNDDFTVQQLGVPALSTKLLV
jgi:hypothetical protein